MFKRVGVFFFVGVFLFFEAFPSLFYLFLVWTPHQKKGWDERTARGVSLDIDSSISWQPRNTGEGGPPKSAKALEASEVAPFKSLKGG